MFLYYSSLREPPFVESLDHSQAHARTDIESGVSDTCDPTSLAVRQLLKAKSKRLNEIFDGKDRCPTSSVDGLDGF